MPKITNWLLLFFLSCTFSFAADTLSFHVKIQRRESSDSRLLIDKSGVLTFYDSTKRLAFTGGKPDRFDIGYDDVTKAQFETTTHMRDDMLATAVGAFGVPGAATHSALQFERVHDYWFYLEYKNGDHNETALLEVPKDYSEAVIGKARNVFGSRVSIPVFEEHGEAVDPESLPAIHSKQSIRVNWKSQPLPEIKTDKATVVVVCPRIRNYDPAYGNQFKLHANERVIAVNQEGTYSIAYIEPGKYHLVSQSVNANGFNIDLEAGKAYYFLQNIFAGVVRNHTMLSRNSEELVMYELKGSYFSEWNPK